MYLFNFQEVKHPKLPKAFGSTFLFFVQSQNVSIVIRTICALTGRIEDKEVWDTFMSCFCKYARCYNCHNVSFPHHLRHYLEGGYHFTYSTLTYGNHILELAIFVLLRMQSCGLTTF